MLVSWQKTAILLTLLVGAMLVGTALAETMTNPFTGDKAAIEEGKQIFDDFCSECHGTGTGGSGPDLTDNVWIYGGSDAEVFDTVSNGRQGGMLAFAVEIETDQIWKVIAYVRTLKK